MVSAAAAEAGSESLVASSAWGRCGRASAAEAAAGAAPDPSLASSQKALCTNPEFLFLCIQNKVTSGQHADLAYI